MKNNLKKKKGKKNFLSPQAFFIKRKTERRVKNFKCFLNINKFLKLSTFLSKLIPGEGLIFIHTRTYAQILGGA